MPYAVEYTPKAEADLDKLRPLIASFILDEIDRLAIDPVALGRKSFFPHPIDRQVFETRYEAGNLTYVFRIFFRYKPGETTLVILAIFTQTIGVPDDEQD